MPARHSPLSSSAMWLIAALLTSTPVRADDEALPLSSPPIARAEPELGPANALDDQTYNDGWAPYEPPPGVLTESCVAQLEARVAELENALSCVPQSTCPPQGSPLAMTAGWGPNGFEAVSTNKDFRVHIGGRVQVDAVALDGHDLVLGGAGDDDAVDFRRARFRIDGDMYSCHSWAAEFDFVNAFDVDPDDPPTPVAANGGDLALSPAVTDLWWTVSQAPWVGNIRIGSQKDALGLEHITSSRYLDFMERSYLQDAFYGPFNNGFAPGVAIFNWNDAETMTYNLGVYKSTQNPFAYDVGDNEYMLTARMTWLPLIADEGARLIHLGLGCRYRGLDQDAVVADGNVRLRSRASLRNGPPSGLQPNLADTNFAGRLYGESELLLAPELSIVRGPWQLQSEYVGGFLNSVVFTQLGGAPANVGQVYFQGGYAQVSYFLTGEHRVYDRHEPRFGRVTPLNNFLVSRCEGVSGLGAWQLCARAGYLDLNDVGIDGGYIRDCTLGLNWFWTPFSKMQFNYIYQQVQNTQRNGAGVVTAENDGDLQGFGVRFAFDF